MALRFFSRLPTGRSPHERPELGRIAPALPLAAFVMGLPPALVLLAGTALGLPSYFAATLAVMTMVVVGGGMMEDSLADAADGLFGGADREKRLAILKDSRHGTYGVSALCLFLVARVTAIGSVALVNPLAAAALWLAANLLGRSASLWVPLRLPPARADGAGATAGGLPSSSFIIGIVLALAIGTALGLPFASLSGIVLAPALVALAVVGWTALCRRLVGGQTGDLTGAAAGLAEIAALAGFLMFS